MTGRHEQHALTTCTFVNVTFSGGAGSGKSALLRFFARVLTDRGLKIDVDDAGTGDRPENSYAHHGLTVALPLGAARVLGEQQLPDIDRVAAEMHHLAVLERMQVDAEIIFTTGRAPKREAAAGCAQAYPNWHHLPEADKERDRAMVRRLFRVILGQ